jgi:hypothetical protein
MPGVVEAVATVEAVEVTAAAAERTASALKDLSRLSPRAVRRKFSCDYVKITDDATEIIGSAIVA